MHLSMERSSELRKGAWSREEDELLKACIEKYGAGKWHLVPQRAGLKRCRKSCRLRWLNYLKPDIKRGEFAEDEVDLLKRCHRLLGNRWSLIAGRIPGRTANDVKNYWNTHIRKKQPSQSHNKYHKKVAEEQVTMELLAHKVIRPQPLTFSSTSRWLMTSSSSSAAAAAAVKNRQQVGKVTAEIKPQDDNNLTGWCRENFPDDKKGSPSLDKETQGYCENLRSAGWWKSFLLDDNEGEFEEEGNNKLSLSSLFLTEPSLCVKSSMRKVLMSPISGNGTFLELECMMPKPSCNSNTGGIFMESDGFDVDFPFLDAPNLWDL